MRNISECKAEIFRRSEEKLRARKKRRAIALGTGIPVCLCALVILSATVAGRFWKGTFLKAPVKMEPDCIQDVNMQASSEKEYTVTDPETADAILKLLGVTATEEPDSLFRDEHSDNSEPQYNSPARAYRIRLSLGNDVETVYWVEGTCVWNMTTGEFLDISEQNAARLIQLLTAA